MTKTSLLGLFLVFLLMWSTAADAARTDVVYMQNGDRVTGEIKSLFRGRLEFKTDHMGTLFIDWENIDQILTETGQSIELTDGQRFYGTLKKTETPHTVMVSTREGAVDIPVMDVTNMYPVKSTWWQRMENRFRLGFNWDKSSEVGKYNLSADTVYRHPDFISRAELSTEFTTQSDENTTTRANISLSHLRFRQDKQFRSYFGNFDHNESLGLDLRTLIGIGHGWIPVRTGGTWFSTMIGLAVNHEIPVYGNESNNVEGVLSGSLEYYKYSIPKKAFRSVLMVYPSLSESGRVRAEFNTNFDLEIVSNFFWDLEFYTSYDSEPVTQDAESIDYGINSSIAYKF